jgi:DNA (cytosine-5)-methyltransferase 1
MIDLCCGIGGASVGYKMAGWQVALGVDTEPYKDYPFSMYHHDFEHFLETRMDAVNNVDLIHLGLPKSKHMPNFDKRVDAARRLLKTTGKPYVIEFNEMDKKSAYNPIVLCGTMFGKQMIYHKFYETNVPIACNMVCQHIGTVRGGGLIIAPGSRNRQYDTKMSDKELIKSTLEIGWTDNLDGLRQATPPYYTYWIGRQLINYLKAE